MNLQVQPLKVLATREVVMNKMDYSTFLGGTTKDELDKLDKLGGRYKIKSSKLAIEAIDYEKLWITSNSAAVVPLNDWEYLKNSRTYGSDFGDFVLPAVCKKTF